MAIPAELRQQILAALQSLPNMHTPQERQGLIFAAGLEQAIADQLPFDQPPASFWPLCVTTLARHGAEQDGRRALIALLTGAQGRGGQEMQAECRRLIAAIDALPPPAPPEIRRKRRLRWLGVSLAGIGAASAALIWLLRGGTLPLGGVIQDQRGRPLSGVTVTLKEFPGEAVTDEWGKFALRAPTSKQMTVRMMFRKTGCEKSPQDVTAGNTALTVQMQCE